MKRKLFLVVFAALVIAGAICAFTACDSVEELLYDEPENISYDGTYITWDRVDGANHYTVSINGGEATRSNSTTYSYSSNDTFEVTVTAVFDEGETSASITFKPLSPIENVYVSDDGVVSWDVVAGANAYEVRVNGTAFTTTDTVYDDLAEGSNRVRVKPIVSGDTSYYSSYSDEIGVYIYSAPSNIHYDGLTLSWTGNASSYAVTINGSVNEVTGNTFTYDSQNRDFTVDIKSLGNHTTTYDSAAASEEFHYLSPITDLIVENGAIKWDPIENAESYRIRVNGVVRDTITETEYAALSSGVSLDVEVMPVNGSGNYFSSWSAIKSVYILETPTVRWNNELELDGAANNNFLWDAVNAADGYTVRLTYNGELVDTFTYSANQRDYSNAYAEAGVYTIEVKANASANNADQYDSRYSLPITVERLASPTAATENFIVSDRDSLAAGFTVNFNRVSGATGYRMYKDGVEVASAYTTGTSLSDRNVADVTEISEQHYTYTIRSMGGMRTVSGATYVTLPCLSANALSFDITVQASPQSLYMSDFILSWSPVSGSNGYTVSYSGNANTAQTERYDLSTINPGTYNVSVSARGNGSNVLASNLSAPVNIIRLEAPVDIEITSAANGTLDWTDVPHATGYTVYLGLSETALDTDAYENMYQYITTEGTALSMIADANEYNEDGTIYYMTSPASPTQQFIRLAAPTFPEGAVSTSTELRWNAPSNVNTSEYTPVYSIYSDVDMEIEGATVNGTRYDISYLEGGIAYTFYVKAVGNDTRYLDSELSAVYTVYKLSAPEIVVQNNMYTWSGVTNASSYYLEIDGTRVSDEFHVSGSTYSYTPRFTTAGDHTVILRAVGDGRYTLDSANYTLVQRAEILQTPEITFEYSDENYVVNGSVTVTVTEPVPHNNGYQYEVAGTSATLHSETYTRTISNTGSYAIRVRANGGTIEDGIYYIDSLYAGGNSAYTLILLGAPSVSSFRINTGGVISWDAISGSYGYDYMISYDNGQYSEVIHRPASALDPIDNFRQYRTISIRVRASGNGVNTVSSEWVTWTWTNSSYNG